MLDLNGSRRVFLAVTLTLVAIAAGGVNAKPADALLWVNGCGWAHVHSGPGSNLTFTKSPNWEYDMDLYGAWPIGWWNGHYGAKPQSVIRQAGDWWNANMRLWSGHYGYTGWAGLTQIPNCGHEWFGDTHYNLSYVQHWTMPNVSEWKLALGCHETGHLYGLDHDQDGCMGFGYFAQQNKPGHHWYMPDPDDHTELQTTYPMLHGY